ncbi:Aste57867_24686 [Aphanomyces stellatus]|uniref:Aste57867_24686 protein n=1 Tax=Aphanomyces stellatus TaxID=120398 RepID=A0A485LR78_9STRA|nr:hypothetical protein As57867_024608 [Aphanomyces stellatus]VFU01323.1 Aste57867_24686 [Aphanomyces stellatus]
MEILLSADVALLVFAFLPPRDLLAVEQTCVRFQSLVAHNRIWQPLYAHLFPQSHFGLQHSPTWKHVFLHKADQQHAWRQGTARCVLSQVAHSDGINSIAAQKSMGPHANLFATCSFDRTVKVWRKPTTRVFENRALSTLSGHQNAVWSLAWGPSAHELFSASFDGTIRSWDVSAGINTRVLWANADRLLCMAVEANEIWTGSLTGHMIQWDTTASNPVKTERIQCVTPCISSLLKLNHLIYVGGVKHLEVWDERYLDTPVTLLKGHDQAIMSIAAYSESLIMTVSKDGTLKGWDANGLNDIPRVDVRVHKAAVRSIATCDDMVVTSSNDSTVYLWQASRSLALTRLDDLRVHTKQVPSVDLDECHVYTASCDTTVTIHEYTL